MELLTNSEAWIGFVTLFVLELVLGIDNIVFISILAARLPASESDRARRVGLSLALITRILFLLGVGIIVGLTEPFAHIWGFGLSGRALILIIGGLFLIFKATKEIHEKLEGDEHSARAGKAVSFASVIVQILILDMVFSIDSVITAVGMVKWVEVMIAAVIASVAAMLWFSGPLSKFVERHPSIKMLALSFLILIGANLVADGLGQHIPKGYTYFALAFSVIVELLNLRVRSKSAPVVLHEKGP